MKIISSLYSWIFSFLISSFIFLWGFDFSNIGIDKIEYNFRYSILILLIPIIANLYNQIKKINFNIKIFLLNFYLKNKVFLFFFIFIFFHLLVTNYLNETPLRLYNIESFIFLCMVSTIYINYRDKIIANFHKIINLFVYLLVIFFILSFFSERVEITGSCVEKYYFDIYNFININILSKLDYQYDFKVLDNLLYQENSHLAITQIAVLFYLLYMGLQSIHSLLLFFIVLVISMFYLSTTFLAGLIICAIVLIFYYFKKKENYKKIIILNIIIAFSSYLILVGDYSCSKKIENINFSKIFNKNYWQKEYDQNLNCISNCKSEEKAKEIVNKTIRTITGKNTTSIIYERSISTNIATFKKNILGWGFNNNDMATKNWINDNKYLMNVRKIYGLNYNDGLGNLFKLINEFGIFVFLLFYYFSFYLFKKEKIKPHKIFFISIFVVQLFRSAGYFNGGFLLAIIEILFFKKFIKN